MKSEELKELLIGKRVQRIESCSLVDRFCIESITFEDGTEIEFFLAG